MWGALPLTHQKNKRPSRGRRKKRLSKKRGHQCSEHSWRRKGEDESRQEETNGKLSALESPTREGGARGLSIMPASNKKGKRNGQWIEKPCITQKESRSQGGPQFRLTKGTKVEENHATPLARKEGGPNKIGAKGDTWKGKAVRCRIHAEG